MFRLLLPALLLTACTSAVAPDDLVVQTERINWCGPAWKATFTSARVSRTVEDTCIKPGRYDQSFRPTKEQWAAVKEALETNRFAELPATIEVPVSPDGTAVAVVDDLQSCIEVAGHRVCGEHNALVRTEAGSRFRKVWVALNAIAPEPQHERSDNP